MTHFPVLTGCSGRSPVWGFVEETFVGVASAWASSWSSNARAHVGFMYTGGCDLRGAGRWLWEQTRSVWTAATETSGASTAAANSEVVMTNTKALVEQQFSRWATAMVTFAQRGVPRLSGCAPGKSGRGTVAGTVRATRLGARSLARDSTRSSPRLEQRFAAMFDCAAGDSRACATRSIGPRRSYLVLEGPS